LHIVLCLGMCFFLVAVYYLDSRACSGKLMEAFILKWRIILEDVYRPFALFCFVIFMQINNCDLDNLYQKTKTVIDKKRKKEKKKEAMSNFIYIYIYLKQIFKTIRGLYNRYDISDNILLSLIIATISRFLFGIFSYNDSLMSF
jgi:hypothetical protein